MPLKPFSSLRSRFLVIVVFGVVLPLAIAGSWLARSSVRAAENILRTQLDTSLKTVAAQVEERWGYRRGDLLLLASNEVTVRTVSSRIPAATAADSVFMARLDTTLKSTIAEITILAADGTVRWAFGDTAAESTTRPHFGAGAAISRAAYVLDTIAIKGADGQLIGRLEAHVRLSAVLPTDSVPILVKGAQLTVADRISGRTLEFAGSGSAPRDGDRYVVDGHSWLALHHAMSAPLIDLTASAPADAIVGPFERTAKLGLLVLVVVMLLVLALSGYFTARMTRSLERLVGAADAVAAGDLQRNVDTKGDDEVGRLGRSFNTMTQSLRRTLDELAHREALAAVGEFAASLSHEVRNGLSAVRVDLQRVEESAAVDQATAALVTRALRNVQRLDSSVTGALAVARSARAELQVIDLRSVLGASYAAAEGAFATSGCLLSLRMGPEMPSPVRADAAALEQLFLNLLLNAAQAMPAGGKATLELEREEATCTVTVRDDGPGMAIEQLARSGRPFYSSKRGGTGLGLSIARKIAEAHRGEITIQSQPGQGTVVRVQLPLA